MSNVNTKYLVDEINHCFEISSLVEFAKHVPDEGEFYKMIALAEDLIKNKITEKKPRLF